MKQKLLIALLSIGTIGIATVAAPMSAEGLDCSVLPDSICSSAEDGGDNGDVSGTGTWKLLIWVLNIMIALVGLAATGAVIYAGILYASAGGSSDKIAKAKTIITNTAIGIVTFGLMYMALNWLIPGGIFS